MAHDVFISYAAGDKPTADAVCAALEARGVRCWIAPRDILPGVVFSEAIVGAIHASRVFVLVFSSHSNTSPHVMREVERAVNRGLPILPLRIEDVPLSPSMEYFISTPHWLDALTPPLRKHLAHLADTVGLLLARAEAAAADAAGAAGTAGPAGTSATVPVRAAAPLPLARRAPAVLGRPVPILAVAAIAVLGLAAAWAVLGSAGGPGAATPSPSALAVAPTGRPSAGPTLGGSAGPSSGTAAPSVAVKTPISIHPTVAIEPVVTRIAPVPGDTGAGLAWDGRSIWVSGGTEIFKVDPSGRVVGVFTPPDYTPEGLTWDGSRFWLFTTDSSTIYRFSVTESSPGSEPRVVSKFAAPTRLIGAIPHALAWDGGHLWLSDFYSLYELEPTGRVVQTHGFGQEIVGLAAEARGLWLAFANWPDDATLEAVSKSGQVQASYTLPLVEVSAMAWVDNYLLVAGADQPGGRLSLHRVDVKAPW